MGKRDGIQRNNIKKRIFSLMMVMLLSFMAVFALSGCSNDSEELQISKQLKLYFVNAEYMETGDEKNGVLMEYDNLSIQIPKAPPEGMTEEETKSIGYTNAVTSLWEVPEKLSGAATAVTEKYGLRSVICKEGTAYVDLVGDSMADGGGSTEETLFISQIVETLTASFDEIENVQFLIDGEVVETLMGHCDVTEPFTEGFF